MGEKDLTEKILEDYDDVFADIMNGLLFHGEQIIKPQSLENASVHSQYKAEGSKLHEQERDTAKYWNGPRRIRLAVLGIENQTVSDPLMPVRVFSYDGASYRKQMQEKADIIVPTVTIVLHFGIEKRWSGATNLKELLQIPKGMESFVNDYNIHVFDVAWLTDEEIARFHSDFRIVANFFQKKRTKKDYIPDDPTEITHVDELLKLLSVMTNDEEYAQLVKVEKDREELRSMCDVVKRIKEMGAKEGEAIGEARGKEIGKEIGKEMGEVSGRIKAYAEMVQFGDITLQKAAERLNMTEEEFQQAIKSEKDGEERAE